MADKIICEPKVYFHYEIPPEPSTDEEFDCEPVDFPLGPFAGDTNDVKLPDPEIVKQEQHTLAIIKPSAFNRKSEIIQAILEAGFTILKKKAVKLFPEQAAYFYEKHFGRTWFPKAMLTLSDNPILVLILAKENAVEDFKNLCGPTKVMEAQIKQPTTLRARFGTRGGITLNAVHASDSIEQAGKEIFYFFKDAKPEPQMSIEDKLDLFLESNYASLLDGLTDLCKEKPMNPALWFRKYLALQPLNEKPLLSMPDWPPPPDKR